MMLKIAYYQSNANQIHSEISQHTCQYGYRQKHWREENLVWRKGNPSALLLRMFISAATMESIMEVPQKLKIELHMIQQSHPWVYT